jgi:hypothetical protein
VSNAAVLTALLSLTETVEKSTAPWVVTAITFAASGSAPRNFGVMTISVRRTMLLR